MNDGTSIGPQRGRGKVMAVALPSGNVASYLAAVEAAAVVVTDPWRVNAVTVPQLKRLPRAGVSVQWLAWIKTVEAAQRLAQASHHVLWQQRGDGVRVLRALPEIVASIEGHAADLGIVLTAHERACQRATELARRLDETLAELRSTGALGMFNRAYKLHRQQAANARPYVFVFDQLRDEVIRYLAETPHAKASPAALHLRLRARFSWYCFDGSQGVFTASGARSR